MCGEHGSNATPGGSGSDCRDAALTALTGPGDARAMPSLPTLIGAYQAPLLAFVLSLALVLAGRFRRAAWVPGAAAGAGALLGWALRLAGMRPWQALFRPAAMPQHLLLVAVVVLGAGLATARTRSRWLTAAAAVLIGWWVARNPATAAQFWRAWLAVVLLVPLLLRVGDTRRLATVPLALAAGLLAIRVSAPWGEAGIIAAAAVLPLLAVEGGAPLPLALLGAAMVAVADLGAGRLPRGGFGPVDLACLLALAAPFVVGWAAKRMGQVAAIAPVAVAALAGVLAWIGRLALLHR